MQKPYQIAEKFCQTLHLKRNTRWRGDCPVCNGSNTFSVNNEGGSLKFYCFKNSCGVKGIKNLDLSLEHIKAVIMENEVEPLYIRDTVGWSQNIKANAKALQYLIENNCYDAYEFHPQKFFYDRVRDRIVFVEYDTINSFKLATGRSLSGAIPKWYKYIALPGCYFLMESINGKGKDEPIVIVEDAASACSISRVANGLALCGTNYNLGYLSSYLKGYKNIFISLDADAKLKSLRLQKDLLGLGIFDTVNFITPRDDIKYLGMEEIEQLIKG